LGQFNQQGKPLGGQGFGFGVKGCAVRLFPTQPHTKYPASMKEISAFLVRLRQFGGRNWYYFATAERGQ
jgi:hypothetical protein